jgi:lysyl-tRNA synthetase class 2
MHLRVAPELYLKRLLIGGFPKVFEIARNFRNEGVDATHNPEFTMLEFYESFSDAKKQMTFVEKLIRHVVKTMHKKTSIQYGDTVIDLGKPFTKVSYGDLLKRYALLNDLANLTRKDAELKARQLAVPVSPADTREKILDNIYKKVCRPKIIQPTFVTGYPTEYLPLAKRSEEDRAYGCVSARYRWH